MFLTPLSTKPKRSRQLWSSNLLSCLSQFPRESVFLSAKLRKISEQFWSHVFTIFTLFVAKWGCWFENGTNIGHFYLDIFGVRKVDASLSLLRCFCCASIVWNLQTICRVFTPPESLNPVCNVWVECSPQKYLPLSQSFFSFCARRIWKTSRFKQSFAGAEIAPLNNEVVGVAIVEDAVAIERCECRRAQVTVLAGRVATLEATPKNLPSEPFASSKWSRHLRPSKGKTGRSYPYRTKFEKKYGMRVALTWLSLALFTSSKLFTPKL